MRGGARRSSGAAAVAGGHWLGVWDGEDELPGAALSGVGRLLAGIGRGEQPLGGDADGACPRVVCAWCAERRKTLRVVRYGVCIFIVSSWCMYQKYHVVCTHHHHHTTVQARSRHPGTQKNKKINKSHVISLLIIFIILIPGYSIYYYLCCASLISHLLSLSFSLARLLFCCYSMVELSY